MNAVAINSTKVCCKTNNTLFSKSEVKKQLLLFLTFLFLGMFLSFGQTFSGTSGAIDDDNCPTTNDFTTNVSGVGVLGTTNHFNEVVINITHTYDSDLEITLISPSGAASVLLSSSNGGSGNDFTDTHFRLDAITPISSGTAPFTGDFLPDGDLTDFDGTNADGIWTLQICDNAGQDIGTLDSWEIIFDTEAVEPFDCTNPINPSPSCNDFKVILVLDESGSIGNATGTEAKVEAATLALANVLVGTGAQLSIVEFSTNSQIGSYGGYTNWNTVDQAYYNALSANLGTSYVPDGWTNWEAALDDVITLNNIAVADIVLFMTDGNPTACVTCGLSPSTSSSQAATFLNAAIDESCEIKQQGSHIMMMGVGANISIANLQAISGPILDDGPGNPTLTPLTSDYNLIDPINLTACFLDIAQNSCNNDLSLEKTVYAGHDNGAGCDGSKTIPKPSNSQVTYCFTITNDGDQTISNMDFEDSDIGIDENDLTPAFVTSMIAGQSITYYYEETLSGGQVFPFLNTADVTGQTLTGDPLSDSSSAEVTEPLCTQAASCNLTNIVEEGCEIPAALTEPTVVFSGIEACSAVITMDYTDVGDTDVCGDGDGADFVRTYTLYFDSVAFATCVQNIIINDSTPPVIDNPDSISDISCNDLLPTQQPLSATDCNSVITVVPSIDAYTVDLCNGYAITYRWTATDDCNNTSEKTVTFNVLPDTAPPVLDEPSAISDISCSDTLPTQETLTATDDCGVATVIPSVDAYTVDVCNGYAITYRWTATDGCTNSSEKTVTFNVLPDTTPPNAINACPVASDFGFSNVQCKIDLPTGDEAEDAFWNQSIPMFFEDNCSTLEGVNISDPILIGDYCSGTAIYTIDYYDACGNLNNQCTFSINYGDTMPPVLAEPSAISDISCSATLPIQETLTATDNCGSATVVPSIDAYTVDVCNGYAITYRWTATDDCTNTSEKTVTFNVLPSPVLEVNCPLAVNLDPSSTQQEIQDAYDAWKLGFTYTGGCDATDNLDAFPSLPDFNCGTGIDLSFTYTATDLCNPNGVSCSSTFYVPGVTGLTVDCPTDVDLDSCTNEADILSVYNVWIAGFGVNNGDSPASNIGDIPALPAYDCGAGIGLSFTLLASDTCNPNGVSCTSTFKVESSNDLELSSLPSDVTTDACEDPSSKFDLWIAALEAMTASGGCNAEVEYSVDLTTLSVDGYCNIAGQVVSVDINAKDDCGETAPVTATFTVPAYSNDLALIGDCPTDNEVDGCSTNVEISAAFDIWKAGVLANFSATGGCNAEVEYSTDVSALQAPTQCGTTDQVISVDIKAKDTCGETSVTTCSFTVKAFESTLEVTEVSDESYDSCDYTAQLGLDSAFQAFLDKFGYAGGCDASGQLASAYSAPDLCTGGTVSVTYDVTDLCESKSETASFTITPSAILEVSCPTAVSLGSSSTQQEIEDAYDAWKLGFTYTGGCETTDNLVNFPSLPDFNCGTGIDLSFTYTATDHCNPNGVSCSSTFYVPGVTGLTVDCPTGVSLNSCTNEADILSAYNTWIAGFGVNNGDSPVSNIGDIPALPDYECGAGIGLSFTLSATDACNPNGVSCTSTFKVESSNDLQLLGSCPTENEVDGCSTNSEISASFDIWKVGVLANFSATGGCNAEVEYSTDVSALQAPTQCATTDQVISVDIKAKDTCGETSVTTCSFTVKAFESTLEVTEVSDESYDSCDYTAQSGLDSAFQAFLDKFGYAGGCDASGQLASAYSAPDLCTGGTVSVTYDVTDLCESKSETASFIITPSAILEVSCPTAVSLGSSSTQQEIEDAYDAWKLGFAYTGGCEATDNLVNFPSLPSYDCDSSIELIFDFVAADRCNPNGVRCSSTFNVEGREPVDAGENGTLIICENGTVTAEELFEALEGNPNVGGTWSPELGGANIYTYTVEGTNPCPDATATVTVEELNLEILASEPVCDEDYGTYSVNVQVTGDSVSSSLGTPVDNGGGSWSITNIPTDNDIVITTTSIVSNGVQCTNSVDVISPDCICIELEVSYTNVTCFGLDDGSITVDYVTEGGNVTINGELYDSEMEYEPGTYTVIAYFEGNDDENCIVSEEITIEEPALVYVQASATDVTCSGANDGTITIDSLSEGAFYTIKLNGYGSDLSGQEYFAPGTYFIEASLIDNSSSRMGSNSKNVKSSRVQDPCIYGVIVTIEEPEAFTCTIQKKYTGNVSCGSKKGYELEVLTSNGVGNLTYSWEILGNGPKFGWYILSPTDSQNLIFQPGGDAAVFLVTITDENGCSTQCELQIKSSCSQGGRTVGVIVASSLRQGEFDFEMFPNPTKGKLVIKPNRLTNNNATVEIFDLIGTRILSQNFSKLKDKEININLSNLASQVYYLKVTTKDGTKIKKVVLDK